MTFADDSNTWIIIVLGKSERQVVEFWVENLMKKKKRLAGKKTPILLSNNILGKKSHKTKKVQLTD